MVPALTGVRGYRRAWLRGDLLAGVTVAAFPCPAGHGLCASRRRAAGRGPVGGPARAGDLCGARLVAVVVNGPESTTALITAVAIGPLAASLALLVGVLSVCAGLARLGFIADLLSRPVLVGYLTGVGLIMIAGQLGR